MTKRKKKDWIVTLRVERNITVYVEAVSEDEAHSKAMEWDIVGDEEPGDTINMSVTDIQVNE